MLMRGFFNRVYHYPVFLGQLSAVISRDVVVLMRYSRLEAAPSAPVSARCQRGESPSSGLSLSGPVTEGTRSYHSSMSGFHQPLSDGAPAAIYRFPAKTIRVCKPSNHSSESMRILNHPARPSSTTAIPDKFGSFSGRNLYSASWCARWDNFFRSDIRHEAAGTGLSNNPNRNAREIIQGTGSFCTQDTGTLSQT